MSELVNVDAELAVIGCVLKNPDAVAEVADWLPETAFSDAKARFVYRAVLRLWAKNPRVQADLVTVPQEMAAMGARSEADAVGFLLSCSEAAPGAWYAASYGEIVLEMARLRAIEAGAMDLVKQLHGDVSAFDFDETLVRLRKGAEQFARTARSDDAMVEGMAQFRDQMLRRWAGELVETVAPTGVARLDRMLGGGLRSGQMLVLAARPSMGKSALMLHMARRCRSMVFSLEMAKDQVLNRLAATEAGVPFDVATNLVGDMAQRERLLDATDVVAGWPLVVVDDARTTAAIEARVMRAQQDGPVDCVYVDHIGWLTDQIRTNNQHEKVGELARRCKLAAMRTGVPWVVLSQLNREVESRPGCLPYMSDLRESGRLEEDADAVALLYRRKYYSDKGMVPVADAEDWITATNWQKVSLNLAKNRNGDTGMVDLGWEAAPMRFHDVSEGRWAA